MPLRWKKLQSWILTTLLYGGLGALLSWYWLEDFHGQLLRLATGIGAATALAGLIVQYMDGRLTRAAGWSNTARPLPAALMSSLPSPLLSPRIAPLLSALFSTILAALLAVPLAIKGIGPYAEFVIGSGEILWEGIALALVALGTALIALGTLALIVTLTRCWQLRAERPALRQCWRTLRTAFLAGVVIVAGAMAGVLIWPVKLEVLVASYAPDHLRRSGWLEAQQRTFSAALGNTHSAVLVVPFTASDRSVDRAARSLMTRLLAASIADTTGLVVADPTLVTRALGSTARVHDPAHVWQLARALDARTVVQAEVAVNARGDAFEVTLTRHARADDSGGRWGEGDVWQFGPVAFSDTISPEAAFVPLLPEILLQLGHATPAASTPAATAEDLAIPENAVDLARDPGTPVARALRLQLLAAAHPPSDIEGEHLWERSVVAVRALPPQDAAARLVRARAALHLGRRPYALAQIEGLTTPDALALRQVIDGNLYQAEALAASASSPLTRLLLALDSERLRGFYGEVHGYQDRRHTLLSLSPQLAPWLYPQLSRGEWFQPAAHELVRAQLSEMGVFVPEDPRTMALRKVSRLLRFELPSDLTMVALPVAIERTRNWLWRLRAGDWAGHAAADRLAPWDMVDALYAANRAAAVNTAYTIARQQGLPERFMRFRRALGVSFHGYPPLEAITVHALAALRKPHTDWQPVLHERQRRLAFDLVRWEGAHSWINREVQWAIWPRVRPDWRDEPPGPWQYSQAAGAVADRRATSPVANARRLQSDLRTLAYSQHDPSAFIDAWRTLRHMNRREEALALFEMHRRRFEGNSTQEEFVLTQVRALGDPRAYEQALRAHLAQRPDDWRAHVLLAQALLSDGNATRAQTLLEEFPGFSDQRLDNVVLSNYAEEGAEVLWLAGETQRARPLLELTVRYGSGSMAEMLAHMRLAGLAGDTGEVMRWTERARKRYNSAYANAQEATLMFRTGRAQAGWKLFSDGSQTHNTTRPWEAALAGHRIAGSDTAAAVRFARQWRTLSGGDAFEAAMRAHFLYNYLLVDRTPDATALEAFLQVAEASPGTLHASLGMAYAAYRRGEHGSAASQFAKVYATERQQTLTRADKRMASLPYLVAALLGNGDEAEAQKVLDDHLLKVDRDYYYLLGAAALLGHRGQHEQASRLLREAFVTRPDIRNITVPPSLQALEICESLLTGTGDERYRELLLDFARRLQSASDDSWAHGYMARFTRDARARDQAVAALRALDPRSALLAASTAHTGSAQVATTRD